MDKLLLLLLLSIFYAPLTAQEEDLLGLPLLESDTGKVYKVAHRMPLFPACQQDFDTPDYASQKGCADKAMLAFIYDNLEYPEEAKKQGVEGHAVISFIVERDGRITSVKILRDPGAGTGEEALRIVDIMAWELPPWSPGKYHDEYVRIRFNLPIKFRLE